MQREDGRSRVIIEGVKPEIDGGRFPIKRVVGEPVVVETDAFTDGHDVVSAILRYRRESDKGEGEPWREVWMTPLVNDRWRGEFTVVSVGRYRYTVMAFVDRFRSYKRDMKKHIDAGKLPSELTVELALGALLVAEARARADEDGARLLEAYEEAIRGGGQGAVDSIFAAELQSLMDRFDDRRFASSHPRELLVVVDRERARFSAWYELFPRSTSDEPGRHGTFADCEKRLGYVASMGFDVLYLPPIHPIGRSFRKGKNNSVVAEPGDVGSPWAIGASEGGHKAVHPDLGTIEDFERLVRKAKEHKLEIAMDIAFQCAPDHPYVKEHPEWFKKRPDGSIQYAENPPKKYQDIYPFDFECEDHEALWAELCSVVRFWAERGVRVFRVDNPHTKPFPFWEWLIGEIKRAYPDAIFLSEAFTRPKVMYRLGKLGFTQSYTYFTWRVTKTELTHYMIELTRTELAETFGPNLWPNTPDILPEHLQHQDRAAFIARLVLAATLSSSYGIYGPTYELCDNKPLGPGKEEYLDSEKYEVKHHDIGRKDSLRHVIARVNRIRRENPALHKNRTLTFHSVDNEYLIAYSKKSPALDNIILTVVNLDPHHSHAGFVEIDLEELGLDPGQSYQAHDLLTEARYQWTGARNYVELNPELIPAHVFRIRRRVRSERDFDYFM